MYAEGVPRQERMLKRRLRTANLCFKIHSLNGLSREIAGWWSPGAGGGRTRVMAIGVRVSFWGDEDGLELDGNNW